MVAITLELSADEHAALTAVAGAAGVSLETVLHGLIAQLSIPAAGEAVESRGESLSAAEERRREQAEVEANIKRWHADRMQT